MPGSRVSGLGGCSASVPGRSPRTRATNHSPSLSPLCCLPTQPCALYPPSFAKSQLSALPPDSPGCWLGKEQGRDDGEQHQCQPWCRSKHPLIHHLILFYSPLSASLHTTAVLFIAPSCSLRVLPASSLLWPHSLRASSPGQQEGRTTSPGSPQWFSKRRAWAAEEGR